MAKGDVKYFAHVAQEGADAFFKGVERRLNETGGLDVDVQYQATPQLSGIVVFSATILGRER